MSEWSAKDLPAWWLRLVDQQLVDSASPIDRRRPIGCPKGLSGPSEKDLANSWRRKLTLKPGLADCPLACWPSWRSLEPSQWGYDRTNATEPGHFGWAIVGNPLGLFFRAPKHCGDLLGCLVAEDLAISRKSLSQSRIAHISDCHFRPNQNASQRSELSNVGRLCRPPALSNIWREEELLRWVVPGVDRSGSSTVRFGVPGWEEW